MGEDKTITIVWRYKYHNRRNPNLICVWLRHANILFSINDKVHWNVNCFYHIFSTYYVGFECLMWMLNWNLYYIHCITHHVLHTPYSTPFSAYPVSHHFWKISYRMRKASEVMRISFSIRSCIHDEKSKWVSEWVSNCCLTRIQQFLYVRL